VALPSVPFTNSWVRNPDWLPLPDISASTNRMVGLLLVYENLENHLRFNANLSTSYTVDWGDGSAIVNSVSGVAEYLYDYASIASPIFQDEFLQNYKQVIVDVEFVTFTTVAGFGVRPVSTSGNKSYYFADITSTIGTHFRTAFSNLPKLERISQNEIIESNINAGSLYNGSFYPSLRIFEINAFTHTTGTAMFGASSDIEMLDLDFLTSTATLAQLFLNSSVKRVKLTALSATLNNIFNNSKVVECEINAPNATNYNSAFNNAPKLRKLIITGMGNVTTATTIFVNTSFEELILDGFRLGANVANNQLSADALLDLANSVGTASGSQTWITTGNPGAADPAYIAVLNSKGYTVTT
jgi:hypothetical protein